MANQPQKPENQRLPAFFIREVSPSYYDLILNSGVEYFPVPLIDHLPKEPKTFKDLEHNVANELKDVAVGDSVIFHCTEQKAEYGTDIEKKIVRIEINNQTHTKLLYFAKEPLPAWKKRKK